MKTLKEIAKDCDFAQNGCNILGLSKGFAKALQDLRDLGMELRDIEKHPITTIWLDKLSSMNTYNTHDSEEIHKAYVELKQLIED